MFAWGIRMTVSVLIPLIYGILFDRTHDSTWMIVTAESICWVEMKGSFAQRTRVLMGGAFLALLFGFAGCITGGSLLWSLLLMPVVVFIACLFKNLGERGSGLSLCVYIMFIIANAYPVKSLDEAWVRCIDIAIGGAWTVLVGVVASLFMSEQTPYKRSIAFIWKSIASLAAVVDRGWDGITPRSGIREIYLKEKEVRTSIDNSLQLFEQLAHHKHENSNAYQLAQLRKVTSLTGATIMAIAEELEQLNLKALNEAQRLSIHAILKSIEVISDRLAIYTVTTKAEEEMLLRSRIMRLQNMAALIRQQEDQIAVSEKKSVLRLLHFVDRLVKLIENAIGHISSVATDRKVYRSYSLMKTLLILHHRHWLRSVRLLANLNTLSFRFAVRTAIAGTIGLFISKWFQIPHGYWLPFTVMIVIQPYFGATITKAMDRILGTVLGVVLGGLLMMLPESFHMKDLLIVICPILMVFYLRRNYSIATFFITIFLIALFAFEDGLNLNIIVERTLCTIGGAALAILAEFALLPTWDKNWLPRHITDAVIANYEYFVFTFLTRPDERQLWTHYRRLAESANSNAFDSFNRYTQEPTHKEQPELFYQMIAHNIRITRELNNFHIAQEEQPQQQEAQLQKQQQRVADSRELFDCVLSSLKAIGFEPGSSAPKAEQVVAGPPAAMVFSEIQFLYLEKINIELNAFCQDIGKWPVPQEQA